MFMNPWKAALASAAVSASVNFGALPIALAGDDDAKTPIAAAEIAAPDLKPTLTPPSPASDVVDLRAAANEGCVSSFRLLEESKSVEEAGRAVDSVDRWSRRLADAEFNPFVPSSRREAAKNHLARMNHMVDMLYKRIGPHTEGPTALVGLNARYYQTQAERLLKIAEAPRGETEVAPPHDRINLKADAIQFTALGDVTVTNPAPPAPVKDARTLAVLKALDERIEMPFHVETPLEDVLKYIREKTQSKEFPNGVPIYVDPVGLMECEKTMASPISIDLEGVSLRRSLQLALKQLNLVYMVDDGLIEIGAAELDGSLFAPAIHEPSPLQVLQKRAERGELSAAERKAFIETLKDLQEIDRLAHPEKYQDKGKTPVGGGSRVGGGFQ